MVKRRDVRMRGILPALTLGIAERKMLRKADRIGIPRGEIEMVADVPVIEIVEEAHEVVGDPSSGRMATNNLALHSVIFRHLLRLKPPIVEASRRIGLRHSQIRQCDLVKAPDLHRPERRSPGLVEAFRRLIVAPKPEPERLQVLCAPR
jgi:hypothetical protein